MTFFIIFVGFWCFGGLLAVTITLNAWEKYYARYEAPFLPVSEWEVMTLEEFQLAAERGVAAGTIDGVTADDVWGCLERHRRGMVLEVVWAYENYYLQPTAYELGVKSL